METNYKLLTFNQDYADEHDVPALAVMTNEEYQKWLKVKSGKLNPKYEEHYARWKANDDLQKNFWKTLKDNGITNTDKKIPWDRPDLKKLVEDYRTNYKYMSCPSKVKSFLSASLGNGGDGFGEKYSNYYLMEEFVKAGVVKVLDVSEDFAKTFKKANLEDLSLCNIFNEDELYDYDEDDEDDKDEDED